MSGPMDVDGAEEGWRDYTFRFGTSKRYMNEATDLFGIIWEAIEGENDENIVLIGKREKDVTVICSMDDELPPAPEEMEQWIAEWEAWMEERMSLPGKGNE